MIILVPIAFLAGVITVFTPCILPVLPIVLAGGSTGTKRKPYAIVAGVVASFTIFVLAGAWVWSLLGIDKRHQLQIGAILLLILAVTLVVPKAAELLERPFLFLTRRRTGDLGGGLFLGLSLGLVFVPCAGPVFAAVSSLAGEHRIGVGTVFVALAYAVGASLPMLLLARGSRRVTMRFRANAQLVRVVAGAMIAATAVVIFASPRWETDLQTSIPGYADSLQNWIEGNHVARHELSALRGDKPGKVAFHTPKPMPKLAVASTRVRVPLNDYGAAPDFSGISHWLNTPGGRPLTLAGLHGKTVLIDFWTYSCINCLRTLPYLEKWDKLYRSKGLVIVGVHTPEFSFEHDLGNVREAVARLGVRYPVPLDNDYKTWKSYSNQYWPAEYLLDGNGRVRHIHFGEGEYDKTEHDIRLLLQAQGDVKLPSQAKERDTTPTGPLTPETYLGYFRIARYAGSPLSADTETSYSFPLTLGQDAFAYAGRWKVGSEKIVAGPEAKLRLRFHARKVHLVLGGKGTVSVVLNGHALGAIQVSGDRLYTLVHQKADRGGLLELWFTPGVQAYAFTFG